MPYLPKAKKLLVMAIFSATPALSRTDDSAMASVYKLVSFPKSEAISSCVKTYQQSLPEFTRVGSATVFAQPDQKTFAVTAAHVPYHENTGYCHVLISPSTNDVFELRLKGVDLSIDLALLEVLEVAGNSVASIDLSREMIEQSEIDIGTQLKVVGVPAKSQMIRWYPGIVTTAQSDLPAFRSIKSFETNANSVVGMSGGAAFVDSGTSSIARFAGILSAQVLVDSDAGRYFRMIPMTTYHDFLSYPNFSTIVIGRDQVISFIQTYNHSGEDQSTWISADPVFQKLNITTVRTNGLEFSDQSCVTNVSEGAIGGSFAGVGGSFAGIGGGQVGPSQPCSISIQLVSKGAFSGELESSLSTLRGEILKIPPVPNKRREIRFFDPSSRIEEKPVSVFAVLGMMRSGLTSRVILTDHLPTQSKSSNPTDADRKKYKELRVRNDYAIVIAWSKLSFTAKIHAWADLNFDQRLKLHALAETTFSGKHAKDVKDLMDFDESVITAQVFKQGVPCVEHLWRKMPKSYQMVVERTALKQCKNESEISAMMELFLNIKFSSKASSESKCFVPSPYQKKQLLARHQLPDQPLPEKELLYVVIFQECFATDAALNNEASLHGYEKN